MRTIAARVIWVIVGLAVVSCNGAPPTTLSISHTIENRVLDVTGSTNLPDGAVIDVRLVQLESFDAAASDQRGSTIPLVRDRFAKVGAGAYAVSVDLSSWPAGTVELLGIFRIDSSQPTSIVAAYGANGERLSGESLIESTSDGRYLEVSDQFALE